MGDTKGKTNRQINNSRPEGKASVVKENVGHLMTGWGRVQHEDWCSEQQAETLELENTVNQMKNTVENFTNTGDLLKGEMEGMEGHTHELLPPDTKKGENEQTWP